MTLWTDYEGTTLAGYPLGRLQRSEGRTAFFLTVSPDGEAAMLRLTESHFDDAELIGRWQLTATVHERSIQKIKHFGRTTFDGVSLAYCLLEVPDGNLDDILQARVLSCEETIEVAEAVAGALAALHEVGLVHHHIDAASVLAVGDSVKLRSDCARECTGDFEADTPAAREALRRQDVRDLGLLIRRCLTREGPGAVAPLPSPFDYIVTGGLAGTLCVADVVTALRPAVVIAVPSEAVYAGMPQVVRHTAGMEVPKNVADGARGGDGAVTGGGVLHRFLPMHSSRGRRAWIGGGIAAAMLALVLWNTADRAKSSAGTNLELVDSNRELARQAVAPAEAHQQRNASTVSGSQVMRKSLLTSGVQAGWHVIAYTYNYERQAEAKVNTLNRRYAGLQPQVFSPSGHAPYFVALGGSSDSIKATAVRNLARKVGLPRDTYARNF